MIEKVVEIGILFDFYGKLLTDKQYMAIDLYYLNDLSLGEIGERIGVSRQGIFDILKRAESKLYDYEDKLHLVEKFKSNHQGIKYIIEASKEILKELEEENHSKIKLLTEDIIDKGIKLVKEKEV